MAVQRFSHLGICVSDLERSLRFYRDALGFRPLSELSVSGPSSAKLLELEGVRLRAIFLERDGIRLELLHFASPGHESAEVPRPMNRLGLTHIALRVDDLQAAIEGARRFGARVLEQTRVENPELGSDVVYVLDPDGVRLELIQLPGDPEPPLGKPLAG